MEFPTTYKGSFFVPRKILREGKGGKAGQTGTAAKPVQRKLRLRGGSGGGKGNRRKEISRKFCRGEELRSRKRAAGNDVGEFLRVHVQLRKTPPPY